MAFKRKNIKTWQRVEYIKILKKTEKCCVFCNLAWSNKVVPTLDHIIPMAQGGSNDITNLTLACEPCNNLRGCIPFNVFKSNVSSPETREEYRVALLRQGKDDVHFNQRVERSKEKKEYIQSLRDLFQKDLIQEECRKIKAEYQKARRMGDVGKANSIKRTLLSKQEELMLTCELIRVKVKNKFCGKKFQGVYYNE